MKAGSTVVRSGLLVVTMAGRLETSEMTKVAMMAVVMAGLLGGVMAV